MKLQGLGEGIEGKFLWPPKTAVTAEITEIEASSYEMGTDPSI